MKKSKLSLVLIIIAMLLTILNFDYDTFDMGSKKTWFFVAHLLALLAAIIAMFIPEKKANKRAQ